MDVSLSWLLIAIPLLSAAVLLLLGRRADRWGHWLGTGASAASAIIAIVLLFTLLGRDASERVQNVELFDWITAGDLQVSAGLLVDPLSLSFVLLVTFVGTLIHIYSVAYMSHDRDRRRFFAYLNLFIAAMLILVLADSFALLFVGWEGVGVASYLLIGFWNQVPSNATAANKAFIMNRVGDVGLLVAMMLMFATFGSLNYETVFNAAPGTNETVLLVLGIALLVGACGKSAQFPLQAWLGDAMAGPTPVSALIHAATMVTAGVYLVVRAGPIFEASATAQLTVAIIGAITLIFGAIVGSAKDDIKKTLAASTMSQIGYMMLAAGLGPIGYAFAIFHLITHGFFKAGMFLGAGSVMHAMSDDVNMRNYGALSKHMKITWITFGLGWLAILGIPPFSGFWSKDKIIETAFVGEGAQPWILGSVALIGAGITAFYMSRLFFMTFHGKARWSEDADSELVQRHPHESPALMTIPMIILSIGSVGLGGFLVMGDRFTHWLEPAIGHAEHHDPVLPIPVIMASTIAVVIIGALLAWRQFGANEVPVTPPTGSVLTKAARADLYQDTINEGLFQRPGVHVARTLTAADVTVVDGAVSGLGVLTQRIAGVIRKFQTGYIRSYSATIFLGALFVVALVLATRI